MVSSFVRRGRSQLLVLVVSLFLIFLIALLCFRGVLHTAVTLLSLPFTWSQHSSQFMITPETDNFDITFANYSRNQDTAGPQYQDLVPPVLHHIALGGAAPRQAWQEARQSCIDMHPGWDAHLWTDEKADALVAEKFPEFKETWDHYRYPIQRVDALRYLALYEYGGVVLDMDLKCKRSLGPLRRFDFVAPAAVPTGFSIGFMMVSKGNAFMGEIIRNLKPYNHNWFGMPYVAVMFSTGCHFASTIHSLQRDRSQLKILAGPKSNPRLHSLSGPVSTPIFDHLGSSSWHSYDASLVAVLGKVVSRPLYQLSFIMTCVGLFLLFRSRRKGR